MDNLLRREGTLEWIKVAKEDTIINNYKSTHCWATERRAPELQPSFSRVHSFSTWAQPSSLVRLSKPVGLCVRVKSVVSGNEWVSEGWGSWEFPVRSKWTGQTSRIKPGLCSVALYMAPLLWPLSLTLLFPHPFSNCLLLTRFPKCNRPLLPPLSLCVCAHVQQVPEWHEMWVKPDILSSFIFTAVLSPGNS